MKRPAIYMRVSTKRQETDSQETYMRHWLEANGVAWDDCLVYADKASGANVERKALNQLETDIIRGLISRVYLYKLDRLSRSGTEHVISLLQVANSKGVDFVFTKDHILNQSDRLIRNVCLVLLAEMALKEREETVRRVNDGLAAARAKGKKLGRRFTYNAGKVKEMFRDHLQDGMSISRVCAKHKISRRRFLDLKKTRKAILAYRRAVLAEGREGEKALLAAANTMGMDKQDLSNIVLHYRPFFEFSESELTVTEQ